MSKKIIQVLLEEIIIVHGQEIWDGQNNAQDLIYHGFEASFTSANTGVLIGNHYPYFNGEARPRGLLARFKDDSISFTEYMVEVDRNTYITNDDEKLFSFGYIMLPIKKELIYVQN